MNKPVNAREPSVRSPFDAQSLRRAKLELVLESRAAAIGPAVDTITLLLAPYAEGKSLSWLSLALQELLRNAFEHGSLGLNAAEKAELCESERFDDEVRRREKEAVAAGKTITVKAAIRGDSFRCTVEDEGSGFDWLGSYTDDESQPSVDELRGRGIRLIHRVFDSVSYNDKGNKVSVRIRLPLADKVVEP